MRTLLTLLAIVASTATGMPVSGLKWAFDSPMPRSFYVTSEVQPAGLYVLDTETPARITAWRLSGVFTCSPKLKMRGAWRMDCEISDVAVVASTLASERGSAEGPLQALDELLTGATASMAIAPDGAMGAIDLRIDSQRPGAGAATEMVRRALLGFELVLPDGGYNSAGSWDQYASALAGSSSSEADDARVDLVNRVTDFDSNVATVVTEGKAIVPGLQPGPTRFETDVRATSTFDTRYGLLTSRHWSWVGKPVQDPTQPRMPDGMASFVQRGELRLLLGRDPAPVGESTEVAAPGREAGGLPAWPAIAELP